jgi:lycopene beta-cyclase
MTYARFLALFVVVPIVLLAVRYRRKLGRRELAPLGLLLLVVYAATTPWDNLAVKWGLWDFHPQLIWGIRLGYLPVEEYLFFGLQTLLVGLWAAVRLRRALEAKSQPAPGAVAANAPPPALAKEA